MTPSELLRPRELHTNLCVHAHLELCFRSLFHPLAFSFRLINLRVAWEIPIDVREGVV